MARLIIVEDHSELASLIASAARARGHEAVTAGTGQAALQAIGASAFDAAVVDLLLPDMRGVNVLDALRAKHVPAVVVSGVYKGEKFAREAIQQHGAQQFFQKPFDMRALLQAVETAAGAPLDAEIIEDEGDALVELEELVPLEELASIEEVDVDEPLVLPFPAAPPSPAAQPPPPPAKREDLPELVAAAPMLSAGLPVLDEEPNTPTRPLDRAELAALAASFSEQAPAGAAEDDLEDQDEIPTRVAPPPPGFMSPAAAPPPEPLDLELAEALELLEPLEEEPQPAPVANVEPASAEAVEPVFEVFEILEPSPPVKAAPSPAEPLQAPPPEPIASPTPSTFTELEPEPEELLEAPPPEPEPVVSFKPLSPVELTAVFDALPSDAEPAPARAESLSSFLSGSSASSEPPPPAEPLEAPPQPEPPPAEPPPSKSAPHDVVLPFAERGGVWHKSDQPGRKKSLPDWSEAGDLSRSSVPKLLTAFYEARHSGELKLKQDSIIKIVYVEGGHPVYAASNLATERFGRFCVRRGAVAEADLERVTALCEAEKLRTGEAMVRLGLLTPEKQLALVEDQVREIIWSTFSWTRGQYSLVAKRPSRQDLLKLQVFPGELILAGALRTSTLLSLRQKMPPKRRLFPTQDPPYLSQDLALSPPQATLLAAADGSKAVEDLLALTDLSERDTLAALAGFELLGLLEERRDEGKRQRISFGI